MKKAFAGYAPYIAISFFIIYWALSIVLCLPANPVKNKIVHSAPTLNKWLGNTWSFFAPPHHYNDKLYLIYASGNHNDTLELLSLINKAKQEKIPFNQEENIMDHLVNHYVTELKHVLYQYKSYNNLSSADSSRVFYRQPAIDEAMKNNEFIASFQTLQKLSSSFLLSRHLSSGTKINMVVSQAPVTLMNAGNLPKTTKELTICSLNYIYR